MWEGGSYAKSQELARPPSHDPEQGHALRTVHVGKCPDSGLGRQRDEEFLHAAQVRVTRPILNPSGSESQFWVRGCMGGEAVGMCLLLQQGLPNGQTDASVCDIGTSRWFNYYL